MDQNPTVKFLLVSTGNTTKKKNYLRDGSLLNFPTAQATPGNRISCENWLTTCMFVQNKHSIEQADQGRGQSMKSVK